MMFDRSRTRIAFIVLLASILFLAYGPDRSHGVPLIGSICIAFAAYTYVASKGVFTLRQLLFAAVLLRVSLLYAPITWSDDLYRYIWDGHVILEGVSPYLFTPEWIPYPLPHDLYELLNSKKFYSVYPPVVQYWSTLSVWLSGGDVEWTIRIMRSIVILAESLTLLALVKCIPTTKSRARLVSLYALNPLVIMELTVNLHTEFMMVLFSVLAILSFRQNRLYFSAFFLGLAAASKLWPLFFLVLLPGMVGWRKAITYVLTTLVVFTVVWFPISTHDMIGNINASLQLYLKYFEFNASLHSLAKWLFTEGTVPITTILSMATVGAWLTLMLYRWKKGTTTFAEGMLWVMLIYFACASTVHPWYIVPLVAFSTLTPYRWPVLWSILIIPTYLTYGSEPWHQPVWWIWIEYVLLFLFITLELMIHTHSAMKARANSKMERLGQLLPRQAKLLDIGTGNGALAAMWQADGHEVHTVDVVNKSRYANVRPMILNDPQLPYKDKEFDAVLLITMLHHTHVQEELINEASRVGAQVIVMEDVYTNVPQKWLTYLFDSLINLEFFGHPHSNRSDEQWKEFFDRAQLRVVTQRTDRLMVFFLQTTYSLTSKTGRP